MKADEFMRKILIGLPTYNESSAIANLLDRTNRMIRENKIPAEILAINDGSSDDTESYLKRYSKEYGYINYRNHPHNMGLAQGMITIINYATSSYGENDVLVVLDADNTHNPGIIPAMVDKLIREDLDIVIASRFQKGGNEIGLSFERKIFSRGARIFAKAMFNTKGVKDFSCGYRAYRVGFLNKMKDYYKERLIEADGFECMIELIVKAGILNARIGEYPLVLQYNLKETPSKMKAFRTIKGYMKLGMKYNTLRNRGKRQWTR